jgi:prohibitin 2
MPWLEWPLIYDIRAKPNKIKSETGTKDLQMVNMGLRVLYRPDPNNIAWMAKNVGNDFAEKVLPSLTQETLKSVIAKYNATSLLTQRNEVSIAIANDLQVRARAFKIILDDVAITDTSFSPRFTQSIEQKQIAQQQAFQAKYQVEEAKQTKQQKIVAAEGEAESARLIGKALRENPAYLKLRRRNRTQKWDEYIAQGGNKVMLPSTNLLLDINAQMSSDPK